MKITNATDLATMDLTTLTLTFKTSGPVSQMAKLHKNGCSMIKATRTCHTETGEGLLATLEDLLEREYPITVCKCAK